MRRTSKILSIYCFLILFFSKQTFCCFLSVRFIFEGIRFLSCIVRGFSVCSYTRPSFTCVPANKPICPCLFTLLFSWDRLLFLLSLIVFVGLMIGTQRISTSGISTAGLIVNSAISWESPSFPVCASSCLFIYYYPL